MAGMAPALLQFDAAWKQIKLVVQHQHLLGNQLVKAHQCAGCLHRTVHIGGRLGDYDRIAVKARLGHPGGECFFAMEIGLQPVTYEQLREEKECVMSFTYGWARFYSK